MTASVMILGGPTAAGKSGLALTLAERFDAVIVSADAMTVYRGLDIGTAKPTPEERSRHPHACIDVRSLHEHFDVTDFLSAVHHAQSTAERVIVVGGTPFYLQALVRPMAKLPPADQNIRRELETVQNLHAALAEIDPLTAKRLHANDHVRIIRALEVHAITGRTMTELHAAGPQRAPVDATIVWLDRTDLRQQIGSRLHGMLEQGYVDEARWALSQPGGRECRALRSFAYRSIIDFIDGGCALDEAIAQTERDTWRFARKQRTWARGLGWTPASTEEALQRAERCFRS